MFSLGKASNVKTHNCMTGKVNNVKTDNCMIKEAIYMILVGHHGWKGGMILRY